METETLTWFGGKAGVRWNADTKLHLLDSDGFTFCRIHDGLRPVTQREANSDKQQWCETCLRFGQESRTPSLRMGD